MLFGLSAHHTVVAEYYHFGFIYINIYLFFIYIFQNNIPVFCPAITDGSLGDIIYFHSYKNPGLILDLVEGNFCGQFLTYNLAPEFPDDIFLISHQKHLASTHCGTSISMGNRHARFHLFIHLFPYVWPS